MLQGERSVRKMARVLGRENRDGLRHAHSKRVARRKGKYRRNLISEKASIHVRPPASRR